MTLPPSLHILVVEDNDSLREATIDFLQANGHHATGVVCAEDVDDTPTRNVPDLYLIDVNLPGETGYSLAQRIRKSQPLAAIVLLTARGQLGDRLEGYASGADNYLIKPVEQSELLLCIHSIARRLKASVAAPKAEFNVNTQKLRLSGPQGEVSLTHIECQLLAAFSRAAGHRLERWQVMELVDPKGKGLVPANAEMRISALRKKLRVCGAGDDAIQTLRSLGYSLNCPLALV